MNLDINQHNPSSWSEIILCLAFSIFQEKFQVKREIQRLWPLSELFGEPVKNCEEFEVLSYLLAYNLACQFHEGWQMIGDSWGRDKELYYLDSQPEYQ